MRQTVGSRLVEIGLALAAPPPGVVTHTVTLRYPLMGPAVVSFDTDDERDMSVDEKRCYDGVVPASGFDDIVDLPCFMDLDWLLDARATLRFHEGDLWCDIELDAEGPPNADLDA